MVKPLFSVQMECGNHIIQRERCSEIKEFMTL